MTGYMSERIPFPLTDLLCPLCDHREQVSPEDPDASLTQILGHFRRRHQWSDPFDLMRRIPGVMAP